MLVSAVLLGCLTTAQPTGDATKGEVQTLVQQLDAETVGERTRAEKQLLQLGPAILDVLPTPESQTSEAAKQALRRIRKTLQDAQALASVEGSTVTLHGRLKLSQVLAEIQKQTGNNLSSPPQPAGVPAVDPEIKVEFDKTPFWLALDQVLDQCQLSVYPYAQPGTLQLVPRGPNDLPRVGRAAIVGPLRIEPTRANAVRDLRSSTPAVLQVWLEVAWEPRLRPIAVKQPMANLKAVDVTGATLAPDDPRAEKEAPLEGASRPGSSAVEMDVSLAMPAPGVKEITSLKGSLRLMLLGKTESFAFDNLLKGKQQKRIAAATVAVTDVRRNGDAWEINVQLHYAAAGDALESHRNWALQNKAYLKGPDGKSIEPDTTETTLRTPKELGVSYAFLLDKPPETMTFVYETPGAIVTKDFAFELKGIKLP